MKGADEDFDPLQEVKHSIKNIESKIQQLTNTVNEI